MSESAADRLGTAAIAVAVAAVRDALRRKDTDPSDVAKEASGGALDAPGASFVTLKREGRLRGCIGSLIAHRPLGTDIAHNARRALVDPRMAPVEPEEWPDLWISVSVLSEPEPIDVDGPETLRAVLRPGVDGLTLRHELRRATFLPSVWESLPEPERFVSQLLRKGGWDSGTWPAGMTAEIYRTDSYDSPPPRPSLGES